MRISGFRFRYSLVAPCLRSKQAAQTVKNLVPQPLVSKYRTNLPCYCLPFMPSRHFDNFSKSCQNSPSSSVHPYWLKNQLFLGNLVTFYSCAFGSIWRMASRASLRRLNSGGDLSHLFRQYWMLRYGLAKVGQIHRTGRVPNGF